MIVKRHIGTGIGLILSLTVFLTCGAVERKHGVDFEVFNLMQSALDFPENVALVKNCDKIGTGTTECTIFLKIRNERKKLFRHGSSFALNVTLEQISSSCSKASDAYPSQNLPKSWNNCVGASSALFFFSSIAEDSRILDFFEHHPDRLEVLLNPNSYPNQFVWFNNRPAKERWRGMIDILNTKRKMSTAIWNPFSPEATVITSYQRRMAVLNLLTEKK